VYTQLSDLIARRDVNATSLARIVSLDPGLTVRLLKMVNSPFYGFPTRIDTVSHAVTVVGFEQLKQLALATTVVRMFRSMPEHLINMNLYWRHSIATALCCRILGRICRYSQVEHLFVAGLLRGVGSLVICINRPSDARRVLIEVENSGRLLHSVEKDKLGFDHAEVGGALLENWALNEQQMEAVRFQYNPLSAGKWKREAAILHLANIIVSALNMGSIGRANVPPLDSDAWDLLGLQPWVISSAIWEVEEHFEDMVRAMAES